MISSLSSSNSVSSTSAERDSPEAFGAYVHLPFCRERCDYCAFALWTDRAHSIGRYVDALRTEIARSRDDEQFTRPSTIYLGGGTPSVVPGKLLARVIDDLDALPGAEITVECNPESTTDELLGTLAGAGVNRISLGVQSTSPDVLGSLGRPSVDGAARDAVDRIARAGIDTYGVDLVYGAAAETDAGWQSTLDEVLGFDPAPRHISVYALTVEQGTALAKDSRRHPIDDVLARRYGIADELLSRSGFAWYEISNFALPGYESQHNKLYWSQGSTYGFGASAHSHVDGLRSRNVWHIDRYLARVEQGISPRASEERLSHSQRHFESLVLGLRTRRGVAQSEIDLDGIEHLVDREDDRVRLNVAGRMLADAVALRLKAP